MGTERSADKNALAFCSIATSSHLHQAQLCLDSLRRHHPEASLTLLLILQGEKPPEPAPGIRYLPIEDCVPAAQLASMTSRYNVAELCFAAKPYLIRHLLAGARQVHYLDGDCFAYAALRPLAEALDGGDVLLTPHSLTPIPDDGLRPRPLTILRAGAFNAGYIGVRDSEQGRRFLDWLAAMTFAYGHNDPKAGMCGDQKWLDLAPALFEGAVICRYPGANVGYWNLHERPLELDEEGRLLAGGRPLLFFHFSGYEPGQPRQLSRYQDRTPLLADSPLEALLREYGAQLIRAVGAGPRWRWRVFGG